MQEYKPFVSQDAIGEATSNRELKASRREADADRWGDFPGRKDRKLINNQMMSDRRDRDSPLSLCLLIFTWDSLITFLFYDE